MSLRSFVNEEHIIRRLEKEQLEQIKREIKELKHENELIKIVIRTVNKRIDNIEVLR